MCVITGMKIHDATAGFTLFKSIEEINLDKIRFRLCISNRNEIHTAKKI
jgi:hypothetical protein